MFNNVKIGSIIKIVSKLYRRHNPNLQHTARTLVRLQFISLIKALKDFHSLFEKSDDKLFKYWVKQSEEDIVGEADKLYFERKYLEVYELLNRLKFGNNEEVHWRIGRALYRLSFDRSLNKNMQIEMIKEAHEILKTTLRNDTTNANVHKWYALILDRYNTIQGLEYRIKHSEIVKQHMARACELNPEDASIQYMLGRWCFEMTHLTSFQRFIARIFYLEPPNSSYQEAYQYLAKAEDLQPGKILANTFLLGQTCFKLGEFYRAQYYLNLVSNLQPRNDYEKHCVHRAVRQSKRLKKYQIGREVLFFDFPFGLC